jgi:hypothetical protein
MSRAVPRYRRNNVALPGLVANVFRITVNMDLDGQVVQCQTFYNDDGSLLLYTDLGLIAAAFNTTVLPAFVAATALEVHFDSIKVENLTNPQLVPYFLPLIGIQGSGPAGHEPTYVSVCVTRQTVFRSACGRGRLFVPGVPSAWRGINLITDPGAGATAYTALAVALLLPMTAGGHTCNPGLYSQGSRTHKTKGFAVLVNADWDRQLATTRRRKIGRGK